MKYLCLIYDDEKQWVKFPKEVQDQYMGDYGAFTESIKKSGQYVGANQLQPSDTATIVRSRNGKVSTPWAATPSSRSRPRPPSACATARCRPPTARLPRRRSSSAATT